MRFEREADTMQEGRLRTRRWFLGAAAVGLTVVGAKPAWRFLEALTQGPPAATAGVVACELYRIFGRLQPRRAHPGQCQRSGR
jgi:hypothetical protein